MYTSLDQDLLGLKEKILLMGSRVEESIRLAMKSLVDRDSKLAKRVIEKDSEIDDLEIDIDDVCHKLLALHQPTAGDMRFITSSMKINSDLERMGDLAVNIVERVLTLNELPPLKPYIDIPRMASIVQGMVRSSLDSLVNRDAQLAKEVCLKDDEVDHLNDQLMHELMNYMLDNKTNIKRALDLILISRNLERIADHATNIAEDVIYLIKGKDVRHRHNLPE
jgi:phosphate transport system protein